MCGSGAARDGAAVAAVTKVSGLENERAASVQAPGVMQMTRTNRLSCSVQLVTPRLSRLESTRVDTQLFRTRERANREVACRRVEERAGVVEGWERRALEV